MNIQRFIKPTQKGKYSIFAGVLFAIFLSIFYLVLFSGQRGGKTFFSNPHLATPILFAAFFGIVSLITGLIAIVMEKDRSIFVFLSTGIGLVVFIFILGEITSPH